MSKKLYLSEKSSVLFYENEIAFKKYLVYRENLTGKYQLSLEDFLVSLNLDGVKRHHMVDTNNQLFNLQFYISKTDLDNNLYLVGAFDFDKAHITHCNSIKDYRRAINKKLHEKKHTVVLLHDQRKKIYQLNIVLGSKNLIKVDMKQFVLNYLNVHSKFLMSFDYDGLNNGLIRSMSQNWIYRHYSRKVFLQLIKVMFQSSDYIKAYISYDYQVKTNQIGLTGLRETGFMTRKSEVIDGVKRYVADKSFGREVTNNLGILLHVLEQSKLRGDCRVFYCLLPIQIKDIEYKKANVYAGRNPESIVNQTDLDLVLAIFNKSKFEFYIIEGKDRRRGFKAHVKRDFENNIFPKMCYPELFSEVRFVDKTGTKGGYICLSN